MKICLIGLGFKKVQSKENDLLVQIDMLSMIFLVGEAFAQSKGYTYSLYCQESQMYTKPLRLLHSYSAQRYKDCSVMRLV